MPPFSMALLDVRIFPHLAMWAKNMTPVSPIFYSHAIYGVGY